jgi:lysozyme
MLIYGVDVASFQGTPGQWRGAAGNIAWAAVKLTEAGPGGSLYVNPDAAADWAYLAANRKARIAYLFGHPSVSVSVTVSLFVTELRKLGLRDADGIMLDLEQADGLAPAHVAAWAAGVMAELEKQLDRRPFLYTYLSFAQDGNCAGLGAYPLWISDPSSREGHPRVPPPWSLWSVHQYSTSGPVDRNAANYPDMGAMTSAMGKHAAGWVMHKTPGGQSLMAIARSAGTLPSTILRKTAVREGTYAGDLTAYINAGDLSAPMPAGISLMLPAGYVPPPRSHVAAGRTSAVTRSVSRAVAAEPLLTSAGTAAVLAAAAAFARNRFGLHLTATELHATLTAIVGISGVVATVTTRTTGTRRVTVGAITTVLGTLATAAATFGVHLSPEILGMEIPAAALLVALLARMHVSPARPPEPAT